MYTVQAHIYLPMSKRDNEAYLDMFAFGTWNATIILPIESLGLEKTPFITSKLSLQEITRLRFMQHLQ